MTTKNITTIQEAFDIVYKHLLTQGERSMSIDEEGEEQCLYRGPNGLKCAIGVLIDDEYYLPNLEGESPFEGGVRRALELSGCSGEVVSDSGISTLSRLQRLHDIKGCTFWKSSLIKFAKEFELTVPEVESNQ